MTIRATPSHEYKVPTIKNDTTQRAVQTTANRMAVKRDEIFILPKGKEYFTFQSFFFEGIYFVRDSPPPSSRASPSLFYREGD